MVISCEIESLLLKMADRNEGIREHAVGALLEIATNSGKDRKICLVGIRAAASDPSMFVRNAAIEALDEIGNANDIHRIKQALTDVEWIVRCTAAESLGVRLGAKARKDLERVLVNDRHGAVRSYAAIALADAEIHESVPLLEKVLSTEEDELAIAGILHALIALGRYEFVDWLPELIRAEWHAIRGRARQIIVESVVPVMCHLRSATIDALVEAVRFQIEFEGPEWSAAEFRDVLTLLEEARSISSSA